MIQPVLERYTLDLLAAPNASVVVMEQSLEDVAVHWHDFYELVYVLDGESHHICNGRPHRVWAGSSMLLSPTDFHGFRLLSEQPLRSYNVAIDPWLAERLLNGLLTSEKVSQPWVVDDFSEARLDFDRLWQESQGDQPGADSVVEAVLTCILVGFARRQAATADTRAAPDDSTVSTDDSTVSTDDSTGPTDDHLRRALFFVDQHFREPLTLAEVAAHAFLSPNYFSERFHELTGISFQGYVQQSRLRFARSLLAATDMPVTEAALAAGFNSPSHFARAYRARYGASPSGDRSQPCC